MSFSEKLKENQMKHAETALLQTVFQDPTQSIGDIWEALESDAEGEIMWDMFRKLTIGTLVTAGVVFAEKSKGAAPIPSASPTSDPPAEEEDEDEFEDDDDVEYEEEEDEFEDDEEGEGEEEEEEEEEGTKKAKSRKKKKASSSKKKEPKALDLSSPEQQKAYRHAIIKCLKVNKARDEDKAMTSTKIRDEVGGDAKQFRDAINELIDAERVAFFGKARGMKYHLA